MRGAVVMDTVTVIVDQTGTFVKTTQTQQSSHEVHQERSEAENLSAELSLREVLGVNLSKR
jgi:hypothetical protein